MGMAPVEQSSIVIAITAALDCTQNVITPPSSRKMRVVENEFGSNEAKKAVTAGLWPRSMSLPVPFSVARPSSRNASPKRKSPT